MNESEPSLLNRSLLLKEKKLSRRSKAKLKPTTQLILAPRISIMSELLRVLDESISRQLLDIILHWVYELDNGWKIPEMIGKPN